MGLAILLIEDDKRFARTLSRFLSKEGHDVEHGCSGEEGVQLFGKRAPDVVILDLVLPGMDGMQTLEQLKKLDATVAVIVMTAHASIEGAIAAVRLGAMDYVTKPIDLDGLCLKLAKAKEILGTRSDLDYMLERDRQDSALEQFVGSCPAMQAVYERIHDVATTDNTTVLITGESGTGKELVARAVHNLSSRQKKPLMEINCTAIPFSLMESELFGHERGAFTGADRTKKGLLELAEGGTLFLDEIGDMDIVLQAKLLRVLQERRFRRVGGARDIQLDARVMAATNQNLEKLSQNEKFRMDLLFRLKVFEVDLPPLRERGDDVLEIADVFVRQFANVLRKPISGLDSEARQLLTSYAFPGNVRELRNIIEQACILARGSEITADLLSISHQSEVGERPGGDAPSGLDLDALGDNPLAMAEKLLIKQAIQRSGGNKKQAAELLGISRFSLQRRLEKLALGILDG